MVQTHAYLRGAATLAFQAYQYQRRLDEGDDSLNLDFNTGSKAGDAVLTWFLVFVMVFLSAMFSGLTLGLLGLDKTGLEIVMGGGSPQERADAKVIYPIREDGNRLLCTLLLGNVAVNALLSITLADIASSLIGFFASTALIVIFGEILPQALCSRYALRVGASSMPLVKFFLIILAPVAVPLAKVLDYFLEEDVGTVHTKNEMMHYLKLHAKRGGLDNESGLVMRGALEMKEKRVREVMTPLEDVYMLPESTRLSFKVVREIFEQGFSRVPVFRGERQRIVGLLFVKDLIFVDPEDETALTSLLGIFARGLQIVDETDSLDDVLRIFKAGHGHLALVRRGEVTKKLTAIQEDSNESKEVELTEMGAPPVPDQAPSVFVGIVTLEDIVEEILGDEIIDETDVFVDVDNHVKVAGRSDFDFTKLRRLDAEFVDERLSPEEVQAVTSHLLTNVKALRRSTTLDRDEMAQLVRRSRVVEIRRKSKNPHSDKIHAQDRIYVRGEAASYATLVLNGKLSVLAGVDGFRAEAGPWTVLGADALVSDEGSFVPDFSAHVATDSVRCVHVTRAEYERAITGRRRRGRRGMGTDGEESDTGRRARLGRRGEMAEKRRRLARMAGQNRGARAGRAALDQFRGEQTGAMSDGERPLAAARGEESGASSQALDALDVGYASDPQLGSSREDLLANATSGNESGSDVD
ncbi:unnamed protein product [Pelagomonas calceolata]|uniref:CNNM transmembrane domain-containing protein n=1 Tax=Pelagomonas calceolata TaxID=35677 RepID=A0A7S3ZR18_9STRA|nr:unnamed protein product [Pelagomonas calceolata]|mmetsp:Transcript_21534/g.60740  ORF Transcript_21534/g.60740 Transcript_21534/m.60740 type:complete len:695 (-) Transcript_21534:36-2120(-)